MKITASYLYPDFSLKRKYNSYSTKKSVKKEGKNFEEYMRNISQELDDGNNNKRKKCNF